MGIPESKTNIDMCWADHNKVNSKKAENQLSPVAADCCDIQRIDSIILINCGHVYHIHCWQQKQKESKHFLCFCEDVGQEKYHFKKKPQN